MVVLLVCEKPRRRLLSACVGSDPGTARLTEDSCSIIPTLAREAPLPCLGYNDRLRSTSYKTSYYLFDLPVK